MADLKDEKRTNFFKEWLEKLQQESWQLELLISGLAFYGIIESRSLILDLEHYNFEYATGIMSSILGPFETIVTVGWKMFFINLLLHIVLRALWIGAIGLRYVSDEIDYKALNFSPRFELFLKDKMGIYDDFIERLEKICSVLFAFTFLIFLMFFSFIMFSAWIALTFYLAERVFGPSSDITTYLGLFVMIYGFLGLIVFIDFVTVGAFKKIKDPIVSKIYLVLYRFYSFVTFSFLYRPLLYNFLDHKYTKRLFFLFFPYLFVLTAGSGLFSNNNMPYFEEGWTLMQKGKYINDASYMDLREERLETLPPYERKKFRNIIPHTVLSQFYVDIDYPSLFFKYYKMDQFLYEHGSDIEPIFKQGLQLTLFGNNRNKDKRIENIERSQDSIFLENRSELKALRLELSKIDSVESSTLHNLLTDSISRINAINSKISQRKKSLRSTYRDSQYQEILEFMMDQIYVSIDSISIDSSMQCYFYNHPNNNEKGILCHFDISELASGMHEIQVQRNFNYTEENKISTQKFTLPFIKLN